MTPYDYGSVMHYKRDAFAINSSAPTIVPTQNSSAFIGNRVRLSPIDILEIQRYYACVSTPTDPQKISTTSTQSTITTTRSSTAPTTFTATTELQISHGVHDVPKLFSGQHLICLVVFSRFLE